MLLTTLLPLLIASTSAHSLYANPFAKSLLPREEITSNDSSLMVDLGYSIYQGYKNSTTNLSTWLGVRFAESPAGANRWQKPQPPTTDRSRVNQADRYASICYQSPDAMSSVMPTDQSSAGEDCLFLNVWAPSDSRELLPVFVWMVSYPYCTLHVRSTDSTHHGGGYGAGSGRQDLSALINANNDSFVGITIQYRLGAFGFLFSDEVYHFGSPNAGLYDQQFALQWVQNNIHLFGGDPRQVTIGGLSAGGGSVMLLGTSFGGTLGISLFQNTFAASPYLPMQYAYNDWIPSQSYYSFASAVGCPPSSPYGQHPQTIFECLQGVSPGDLAKASATISQSGTYGTWAFLPVTDYALVTERPSQSLLRKRLNGVNALVGNNANEGPAFTPQNITTEPGLKAWLNNTFPLFRPSDMDKLLLYYALKNDSDMQFATSGVDGLSALTQSALASGQQQRANNIYAEATFVCPSYWMAEAYTPTTQVKRKSYKYQYSVTPALHGSDADVYFNPPSASVGSDMALAFKTLLGNFITKSDPSVPPSIAAGASAAKSSSSVSQPISQWPAFTLAMPYQIDLNQTGGVPVEVQVSPDYNVTELWSPGLKNEIGLYNAWSWEAGRGYRCDFWRSLSGVMPA